MMLGKGGFSCINWSGAQSEADMPVIILWAFQYLCEAGGDDRSFYVSIGGEGQGLKV